MCGDGTSWKASEKTCVPQSSVCGDNTTWDASKNACVPQSSVCARGTTFVERYGQCFIAPSLMTDDICKTQLISPDKVVNGEKKSTYSGGTCKWKEGNTSKSSIYCGYPSCNAVEACQASSVADGKGYLTNFCSGSAS